MAMFLRYEWLHYLIHTSYKPKSQWFRKLHKHHRLHHFKNENYWFGLSSTAADRILSSNPDPENVETSDSVN